MFRKCVYAGVKGADCDLVVLDHITAAATGLDWVSTDLLLYGIKNQTMSLSITTVIVTHVNLTEGLAERKNRGKNTARITLRDLRLSKAIGQVCDVVVGVRKDEENWKTIIYTVCVDRHQGGTGGWLALDYFNGARLLEKEEFCSDWQWHERKERETKQKELEEKWNLRQQAGRDVSQSEPLLEETDKKRSGETVRVHSPNKGVRPFDELDNSQLQRNPSNSARTKRVKASTDAFIHPGLS